MEDNNLNPKNSQTQDTTPDNLPGVEITDSSEVTQQISQKAPAESLQKEVAKMGLKDEVISDNLEDVIKSAPVPPALDKASDEVAETPTLEDIMEGAVPISKDVVSETKEVVNERETKVTTEGVGKDSKLELLRTYKGDLAKVMGTREGSLVGIASAESDKRHKIGQANSKVTEGKTNPKGSFAKKVGIIILSTVLVVLGAGSVFYFYGKSNVDIITPDSKIASIIFADEDFEFNITDLSKRQILNELTSIKDRTRLSIGRIQNIFFTESFIDEEGFEKSSLVSTSNFLDAIKVNVPTSFSRSLRQEFMVGVHVFDGNQPFIILRTSFYENAFVGMLEWEVNIQDNLSPLFDSGKRVSALPTGNATSTSGFKSQVFSDSIIKNKDARVLKNEKGEVSIIYSFIDKQTIIITTNENTFSEVFTRLTSSRTLR